VTGRGRRAWAKGTGIRDGACRYGGRSSVGSNCGGARGHRPSIGEGAVFAMSTQLQGVYTQQYTSESPLHILILLHNIKTG
jgi:hypothetical protein